MKSITFGAMLALLVLHPSLAAVVLAVATAAVSQPAVVAFAAGVWAWPRISQRIKGWWA